MNENNKKVTKSSSVTRILKYSATRIIALALTVVVGVYLTILIANMGGYVDELQKAQVDDQITQAAAKDPNTRNMSPESRKEYIQQKRELEYKRLGLDQPFVVKSFKFLWKAVTLNFGKASIMVSDAGSKQVKLIISERLGPSLLLMGTSNLILFFFAIAVFTSIIKEIWLAGR